MTKTFIRGACEFFLNLAILVMALVLFSVIILIKRCM